VLASSQVLGTTAAGLGAAVLLTMGACVPLGLSVWALLDITRRPSWAWALAGRPQVLWLAAVLMGTLLLIAGMGVSIWYLVRVRPTIAAAEDGLIT
jgi:hypothetical protein